VSDKRISVCDSELEVEYFKAEVLSAVDYYPFGMMMPDRQYYAGSDSSIAVNGFNGMRRDDEVSGVGNSYTTEFRQLDVRLGRWFSIDPKYGSFPNINPYNFCLNNPIICVDPNGDSTSFYDDHNNFLGATNDNLENAVVIIDDKNLESFKSIMTSSKAQGTENQATVVKLMRSHGLAYDIDEFKSFDGDNNCMQYQPENRIMKNKNNLFYKEAGSYLTLKNGMISVAREWTQYGSDINGNVTVVGDGPINPKGIIHNHPNAGQEFYQLESYGTMRPGRVNSGTSPDDRRGAQPVNYNIIVEPDKIIFYKQGVEFEVDRSFSFKKPN